MAVAKDIKRRNFILKGDLLKVVLAICMPIALYQLFNSTYTLIDQIICAQISTTAQNAVSSISQIKSSISAFGGGLAAGGGVIVARYYGAGDVHKSKYASSNLFFLSLIVSAIVCAIFVPLAEPIMWACQIAPASIAIGVGYFRLQLVELAFVTINSVFIGLEKAKGNSKIVLWLNLMVLIIKLALTVIFIFGFNLKDIIYVEVSTIIAQAALTVIAMFKFFSKNNVIRLNLKMFWLKKEYAWPIIKLSVPIFLGKFVMSMGKVVVNAICGGYWNEVTDGLIVGTLGVSNNICGMITSPTNSFEEGESSIVSQNVGAGNIKRACRSFLRALAVSAIISVVGYVLLRFVFIDDIVNLFTSADTKSDMYKQMVKEIFTWDSLSIIALGINAPVLGLLYGFGKTGLSTILNLSRIGSRIIILLIMHASAPDMSPTLCAGLSMGISNTVILILSLIFLAIFYIGLKRHGYHGMYLTDPEPEIKDLVMEE